MARKLADKLTRKLAGKLWHDLNPASSFRNLPQRLESWQRVGLPGAVVIILVIIVRLTGALQGWEWFALDRLLRYRFPEAIDPRVIIVGITERDIPKVGFPITDAELAKLIKRLNSFAPRAIGLDVFRDIPVASGGKELAKVFRHTKNLVVIEKSVLPDAHNTFIDPPPDLPPSQVGFADILLDSDGHIRRSLLAATGRLSLAAQLARIYLDQVGYSLENGISDRLAFRFTPKDSYQTKREVELERFRYNDGSYVRGDDFGNQILVNWRHSDRFPILSLYDPKFNSNAQYKSIYDPDFNGELIRDRLVLVGYIAPFSAKDTISVPAISDDLINGVEFHAYTISQILSTVLDGRSGIHALPDFWEYLGISLAGILGICLAASQPSSGRTFLVLSLAVIVILLCSYLGMLASWWLPVIPTAITCVGAGLVTQYIQDLRSLIEQRQQVLEQRQRTLDEAFNALHNGPLHSLAELLSKAKMNRIEPDLLGAKLENLDRELRQVYESLRPETMTAEMLAPLHELFYEIFHKTLQRDFIGFQNLKVKISDIRPIDDSALTAPQKKELCAFLEEALCNVGKHAIGATRLRVVCKQEQELCHLQIVDNGAGIQVSANGAPTRLRGGTKHAMQLAKQMGGNFRREPSPPQGTICELTWSIFGK